MPYPMHPSAAHLMPPTHLPPTANHAYAHPHLLHPDQLVQYNPMGSPAPPWMHLPQNVPDGYYAPSATPGVASPGSAMLGAMGYPRSMPEMHNGMVQGHRYHVPTALPVFPPKVNSRAGRPS